MPESDVNYGFNVIKAICTALGMTEHDLDAERKQIELSPRAWLDRKLKALGYTKTSGTSA